MVDLTSIFRKAASSSARSVKGFAGNLKESAKDSASAAKHSLIPTAEDYRNKTKILHEKNEYIKAKEAYYKRRHEVNQSSTAMRAAQGLGILPTAPMHPPMGFRLEWDPVRRMYVRVPFGYSIEYDPRKSMKLPEGYKLVKSKKKGR